MKIHHVETKNDERWSFDPQLGPVRRSEPVVGRSGTDRVVSPEYGTFEVDPDGSFDVPDGLAKFLLNQPGWHAGASPFPPDEPVQKRGPGRPRKVTEDAGD